MDGQQRGTDVAVLNAISPSEVDHINVSTNAMDIQKYTGFNSVGVIEIFQKNAKFTEQIVMKENRNKYEGVYRIPNVFPTESTKRKDLTTLLWIPDQKVDETGQFEFEITGGRVISDFVIEVQKITPDDRKGSGKATFSEVK